MSSPTKRQQQERDGDTGNPQQQGQQQHQATIRSIDETKNNINQAIEEVRRETPRYSQVLQTFKTRQ
ncbi:MAG TPA: hypothetical protein VHF65_05685 [Nitrososphaera sp.]|nr:hypothetical protein [Nitrososphaera sp.]